MIFREVARSAHFTRPDYAGSRLLQGDNFQDGRTHSREPVLALEGHVVDISAQRSICRDDGGVPQVGNSAGVAASTRCPREYVPCHDLEDVPATYCFAVQPEWNERFAMTAEDYLHGVISLVNELVRRCSISSYAAND